MNTTRKTHTKIFLMAAAIGKGATTQKPIQWTPIKEKKLHTIKAGAQ